MVSVKASEQEVLDLLMSLDTTKATGPDGVGPKLLYEAGRAIVPSLTTLICALARLRSQKCKCRCM